MTASLCRTCGTQYPPAGAPPAACPICEDPRQYIGLDGQQWTTLPELRVEHRNEIREEEPGLHSIRTEPAFGIGQRAFLLRTPAGNVLWDCVALLDDATVEAVRALGGIDAFAISHPHYYSTMVEWSRAFDVPVYLHEAEREWVMRPDPCVRFWSGETHPLLGDLALVRCGGHFDGYQVLLWPAGAEGRGVLLAGDQPQVCADRRWVGFMWSYPNTVPLSPSVLREVADRLEPLPYDRIWGAFRHSLVAEGAKEVVSRSVERLLRFMAG